MQHQPLMPHHEARSVERSVRWAPRGLREQVAHVDPTAANPTVSEYTRRSARRTQLKRADGRRFYD